MNSQGRLIDRYCRQLTPGRLAWIGLRAERKQAVIAVPEVQARQGLGLAGDHRCRGRSGSARQVTLISQECIDLIATYLGLERIDPALLRRNLVTTGINLQALRHQRFRVGEVLMEGTAQCHPCLRMEQALGKGAVAAMLGHGGICAKVIESGWLRVGDPIVKLDGEG